MFPIDQTFSSPLQPKFLKNLYIWKKITIKKLYCIVLRKATENKDIIDGKRNIAFLPRID